MTPELLMSLTAAKGLPMPNEEGTRVDAIGDLLRREKRLREITRKLRERGEGDVADALEASPQGAHFGGTATGKNTRTSKPLEWTHAECAQACRGMDDRYFQALRYTYALDDTSFFPLHRELTEWALEYREVRDDTGRVIKHRWPSHVVTQGGENRRFLRELVDMWLLEVRQPWRFIRKPNAADLRRVIMDVSEPIWRRRLSPVYETIADEFVCWLSIGAAHMRYRLRDEAA